MTSECHRVPANRVHDATVLDAARDCVLATGVRRTTLSEVARRAGVSRMTLYRRFPDVTTLLAALMTREFGTLLGEVAVRGNGRGTTRRRLVECVVEGVRLLSANPLLRTVLEVDPQLLIPYVFERLGSTQRIAEQFLHEQVLAGHADDSIRPGDAAAQVRMLMLIAQGVVLSLRPATSDLAEEALFAELAHTLDASLSPEVSP
ncbi:TetR/AcrR family transcriptional regulator [Allokutzneria oryzae]|uniref:TetR/AcrR family transcriptional regulator n=1 Tax=Allokutzneria oryzae TaxID=1378989 RepID=A0ABV5ZXY1_9PSEU